MSRFAALALVFVLIPLTAAAQEDESQQSQGPMTIERVHNTWAIAPDFKVTKVDGTTGRLVGGYGGWVFDDTLLVGAGGYWMTNSTRARDLSYGGAVVEWLQRADRPIGYSLRGLVGFGTSRLSQTIDLVTPPLRRFDRDHDGRRVSTPGVPVQVVFRERFFVFEPQADALVRLTRLLRIDVGAGYRLTDGAAGLDRRLRGVSGSVALQIGGVSSTRP